MTTIVGILDNARDLDKAVGRLARADFEDSLYDEAIVAGEPGNFGAAVFSPGYGPVVAWGSAEPTLPTKPGRHSVACNTIAAKTLRGVAYLRRLERLHGLHPHRQIVNFGISTTMGPLVRHVRADE
jgi:hypothetical protein